MSSIWIVENRLKSAEDMIVKLELLIFQFLDAMPSLKKAIEVIS